jgi:hypothetical protein
MVVCGDAHAGAQPKWIRSLAMSEKSFYGMVFCLALFSVMSEQNNIRDFLPYKKAAALVALG